MTSVFDSPFHPIVGLAAPQVGHSLRIIAYKLTDRTFLKEKGIPSQIPLTFLVNPSIKVTDDSKWVSEYESCESLPNYNTLVKRQSKVIVTGLDSEGKDVKFRAAGFLARLIQHEVDHLDGITLVDRMEPKSLRHDNYVGRFE
jgi:peptide deformylase